MRQQCSSLRAEVALLSVFLMGPACAPSPAPTQAPQAKETIGQVVRLSDDVFIVAIADASGAGYLLRCGPYRGLRPTIEEAKEEAWEHSIDCRRMASAAELALVARKTQDPQCVLVNIDQTGRLACLNADNHPGTVVQESSFSQGIDPDYRDFDRFLFDPANGMPEPAEAGKAKP